MASSCYVCGGSSRRSRRGRLRDAPEVGVIECGHCGLVTPETADAVLVNYEAGSMHGDATVSIAEWREACAVDDVRRVQAVTALLQSGESVLDVGFGAGGFIAGLEANGVSVFGIELERTPREHMAGEGFQVYSDVSSMPQAERDAVSVVTVFHVLEHILDPRFFIEGLLLALPNAQTFIFEVPCAEDALLTVYQNEPFSEFTYWSHHVHLHTKRSLEMVLTGAFTTVDVSRYQRYGLGNHLGWLATGQPGGQVRLPWLEGTPADLEYRHALVTQEIADTLWAVATVA
jgi:2-polyprenyl-3-methyl-5-hydroxy-6-metoxy-1,4-benzoquinol methylase